MTVSLEYKAGNMRDRTVSLYSRDAWVPRLPELRVVSWDYELTPGNLTGVNRPATERSMSLICRDPLLLDTMRTMFDGDLIARTPGRLIVNGEWWQNCYMTASDPDEISPKLVTLTLTATLLDGVWRRDMATIQCTVSHDESEEWLDLPTDMPFDLGGVRRNATVTNLLSYGIPWRMVIYGQVSNPEVVIGGNRIQVDVLVPAGGYLTIDAMRKTVILTAANGDTSNVFNAAHRGEGQGSGSYVFEPLPAGSSLIEWDGSFGFDLTPVEERSTPPWSTLS